MKKQPKVGTLTVIKPRRKARKATQEPAGEPGGVGLVHETIRAVQGALEAGKRLHAVYKKIRGKK